MESEMAMKAISRYADDFYGCLDSDTQDDDDDGTVRFSAPTLDGIRLDACLTWNTDCGQPAADAFCRSKGYSHAASYEAPDMAPNKTKIIGSGQLCEGDFCGSFVYIDCAR
jgi:hypothetical protein